MIKASNSPFDSLKIYSIWCGCWISIVIYLEILSDLTSKWMTCGKIKGEKASSGLYEQERWKWYVTFGSIPRLIVRITKY